MGGHLSPVCVQDFEALAQAQLEETAWAYFTGGAADEITSRENSAAWAALPLLPRVMRPLEGGSTAVTLLGRRRPTPLLLAPVALHKLAHPQGEEATALAAAAQGCGLVLSTLSSVPMEAVAARVLAEPEATRGPLWFQVYLQADRGATRALAQRAAAAGFEALVLTVDAPLTGARDRERRAGFKTPPGLHVHLSGPEPMPASGSRFDFAHSHAPRWSDIGWLAEASGLPVLVKGVLHPDDARHAQAEGAAGVIVSNHGGRTLDTVLPTARALPAVADALGGALPLLVDGGIRRGTDVLKALALGADAVLLGRPQVMALAAGGAPAVAQMLRLLRDEFEIAMALTGCRHTGDIARALIAP